MPCHELRQFDTDGGAHTAEYVCTHDPFRHALDGYIDEAEEYREETP